MAKHDTMQKLAELAQQKNDAAVKRLGQLNQHQQAQEAKLNSLQQFRKEYQVRFQQAVESGLDQFSLNNFHGFILRLDEAIAQQNAAHKQACSLTEAGRLDLQQAQRKLKSFDTLVKRHQENERKLAEKRELRQQDEHTNRAAAVKAAAAQHES